ncbi:MAG: glycosyltransferase family 1 protein [Bacteriovoracaceae bacterium]|nr:glycosyltransferase family 1 protein [Bacteriovoracaceae bacterium]
MKIGINACIINDHPSGARSRFINLYREIFRQSTGHGYQLFEPSDASLGKYFKKGDHIHFTKTPLQSDRSFQRLWRGKLFWPCALRREKFSIFETSYFPIIKNRHGATVLTVHDIRYIQFPNFYSKLRGPAARRVVRSGLRAADLVLTVSEAMKSEILDFEPETKIQVLPNGISKEFQIMPSERQREQTRKNLRLPSKFILSVGHLEKRKNYSKLLEAYSILKSRGSESNLCIVGAPGDATNEIQNKIDDLNIRASVYLFSEVSAEDLAALFQLCELFVFPSVYEGFGIPLLEAMFYQKPFVLSDIQVFREITKNGAIYFDPYDPVSIADKMELVLSSSEQRRNLQRLGAECLPFYQYENIARDYLKMVEQFQ